jgi:hypothetical protein
MDGAGAARRGRTCGQCGQKCRDHRCDESHLIFLSMKFEMTGIAIGVNNVSMKVEMKL